MTDISTIAGSDLPAVDVQFSLVPASDLFIPIILDAVAEIGSVAGLTVSTDAVSSHLSGRYDIVFGAVADVFLRAAKSGAHIVLPFHSAPVAKKQKTGSVLVHSPADYFRIRDGADVVVATQFALIPGDRKSAAELYEKAVDFLKSLGVTVNPKALVTRVDGDAATIFAAYAAILAWLHGIDGGAVLTGTVVGNIPSAEAFS